MQLNEFHHQLLLHIESLAETLRDMGYQYDISLKESSHGHAKIARKIKKIREDCATLREEAKNLLP